MRNGNADNSRLFVNRALSKFGQGNPAVTDGHMAAGSHVETADKKGPNKGSNMSAIARHASSAKTQTLQNKAFPVTDHHDP